MAPPSGPGTFCWFELVTTDALASKQFYAQLFEYRTRDALIADTGTHTMLFDRDEPTDGDPIGALRSMSEEMRGEGRPSHWNAYIQVEDADQTASRCLELGGSIITPAFDVMDQGRMATLRDPTGAIFHVWQPGLHQGTTIDYTRPGHVCWCEHQARGSRKARDFYAKLFGWSIDDKGSPDLANLEQGQNQPGRSDSGRNQPAQSQPTEGESGAGGDYHVFSVGDASIGGFFELEGKAGLENIPANWMLYFAVDDVDESTARAEQLGARVFMPPNHLPNVGRFSVIADPTGAALTLFRLDEGH